MVKVTVVVPVYNPGPFIEPGIASMLHQTLPRDEYEVVYVDDGSTDQTPARLDALAAAQPNIRVIHTPNSGWAGRPRNIGIREANGEYVQFMDQDDSMPPDALRMLHDMATRNRSDIVIGKVASDFRPVPQHLFRRNIDACTIRDAPLISSLTPHKMFRTSFLREHGIEFPEGRVRLEDQLFMVRAYLVARTVSVLADSVCYIYARRADGGNAGQGYADPARYFGNLREILEVVVAHTEPGAFRTELLSRFYRTGMIARLSEPYLLGRREPERLALYREIRGLAQDFIDDDVHRSLGTFRRLRSTLLREDRPSALFSLADRLGPLRAAATLDDLRWVGGRLKVEFHAGLEFGPDGGLFEVVQGDRGSILDPVLLDGILDGPVEIDEPAPWGRLDCFLRERTSGAEWRVPTTVHPELLLAAGKRVHPVFRASAVVDVSRLAGGHPIEPGDWELTARVFGPGIDRRSGILPAAGNGPAPAAIVSRDGQTSVVTAVGSNGVLIRVGPPSVDDDQTTDTASGSPLAPSLEIPLAVAAAAPASDVEVIARYEGAAVSLAGRIGASSGRPVIVVSPGPLLGAAASWRLTARLGGPDSPEHLVATLDVADLDGERRSVTGGRRTPLGARLRRVWRRLVRAVGRRRSSALGRRIPGLRGRWR